MRKRITSLLLTLAMLLSLVPAMGVTASAAGTEIEAVSFSYTGYAEGKNVADAVVTCNTAGVDFTYKWQYSDSGGSYSDATKLSAQFISGIKYTLWIYFKAQDGLALAELNETDVTLGGDNPGVVYTNYTIDEVKYSYGVPFSMSPLGGVTKYIVGFYTQGGKIGDESYRVERVTGTDGKLAAEQVPTPTKEDYIFAGWYTAASGGTLLSLDTVYTDSRNEYYARWVPTVDIDVTFDANGGKVNGKDTDTITIPAADKGKLASLPVPTREGYTFDGWYTAASGGMKITETTVFSEATTVYALWGAIDSVSFTYTGYAEGKNVADAVVTCNTAGVDFTYKWQYSDSGGSYSDATKLSAQFISGIKYTLWIYFKAQDGLALAELNETDVTLGGDNPGVVYTNYTIDEVKYSYGVPFSMSPLGGVTKYIVGFYTQGGKIGDESYRVERVTGTDGKLAAEQVPTPTKEDYIFAGWYTAASGGTLLSLDTVYTDSRNEYYARWTENPALTGTATITGTALGWNDKDNAEYYLYPTTMSDADIRAQWKKGGTVSDYTHIGTKDTISSMTVDGKAMKSQSFSFSTVPAGDYKLVIFKPDKYVPKIVPITVGTTDYTCGQLKLWLYGDVNYDGKIRTGDATQINLYLAGERAFSDDEFASADITGDGKIRTGDATQIYLKLAGDVSKFDDIK